MNKMYEIKDKVILITGAATGIGAADVREFLEEGAKHVAVLDIDGESGIALENQLKKKYGKNRIKFIKCDVTDEKQLFGAFETVLEENGYIDVVVNNAGFANESSVEMIRKEVDLNYTAIVLSTYKAIELMGKGRGGRGGTVINISSIAALCQPCPASFVYFGLKSAILQFSNCVGKEPYFSKTGVRVITICFGATDTQFLKKARSQSFDKSIDEEIDKIVDKFPMQTPETAARGVVEVIKNGESGSTWLVANNKHAVDITPTVTKAYELLSSHLV